MTEMEQHYAGEIIAWALLDNDEVPYELTTAEMTRMFWDKYFSECEMGKPTTGMEIIQ